VKGSALARRRCQRGTWRTRISNGSRRSTTASSPGDRGAAAYSRRLRPLTTSTSGYGLRAPFSRGGSCPAGVRAKSSACRVKETLLTERTTCPSNQKACSLRPGRWRAACIVLPRGCEFVRRFRSGECAAEGALEAVPHRRRAVRVRGRQFEGRLVGHRWLLIIIVIVLSLAGRPEPAMIPYALAVILIVLAALGLLAAGWRVRSRRSYSLFAIDRRSPMRGTMPQASSQDQPHCDACQYERERAQVAAAVSHGVTQRCQESRRIAPRRTGFPDPGRSRREPWLSRRPGSTNLVSAP
jgi:hypothetical protein